MISNIESLSPFEFFNGIIPNIHRQYEFKIRHYSSANSSTTFKHIKRISIYNGKTLIDHIDVNSYLSKNNPCFVSIRINNKYPDKQIVFNFKSGDILTTIDVVDTK